MNIFTSPSEWCCKYWNVSPFGPCIFSSEFRGRATQIHVFPLSFEEFYFHVGGDERKALDTYMLYGGMPRLLALTDEKDKKDYLSSLYSELYVKDIVERNGIEREDIPLMLV